VSIELAHSPILQPCVTILGNRGSGKSFGLMVELLWLALLRMVAVLVLDRPGSLARAMVGHLCANGMENRVVYERAADTQRVLRWPWIQNSTKPGLDGERENEMEDERFKQIFQAKKHLKISQPAPYTNLGLDISSAVFRSQPRMLDLDQILDIYHPGTKDYGKLIENASAHRAVDELIAIELRSRRNPVHFETIMGASHRMLRIVQSPVLRTRHGPGISWRELLREKYQIYFDLSNVSMEAARALAIAAAHAAINAARAHFEETGKPLPVVIVLEEAGALDLVTPFIITAMQELRKAGVAVWIVSQTIRDFDDEIFESLLSLCDVHYWYRMNSGIERAAKDLADPTFNPTEVHYTRERVVSDGMQRVVNEVRGRSTSERKTRIDKEVRTDTRESISYIPIQRTIVDEYFKTPQIHEQEFRTKLANLQVGGRAVRGLSGVRLEHAVPLGEPWPLGLTDIRTQKAIERIRSRPMFVTVPQTKSLPVSPTIQPAVQDSLLLGLRSRRQSSNGRFSTHVR